MQKSDARQADLASLPQVVLPSQHLEEGVYAADEATRKLALSGRRRMMPIAEDPFQVCRSFLVVRSF